MSTAKRPKNARPRKSATTTAKAAKKARAKVPVPPPPPSSSFGANAVMIPTTDALLGAQFSANVNCRPVTNRKGKTRQKCDRQRLAVVGGATPAAEHPKRKQLFAVQVGQRFTVADREIRRDLRAGAGARARYAPAPAGGDANKANGYSYTSSGKLVCDLCGAAGARKIRCPFGYCPSTAACSSCKKERAAEFTAATHRARGCEAGHAAFAAAEAERGRVLASGELVFSGASGDWKPGVPKGHVEMSFHGRGDVQRTAIVPMAVYKQLHAMPLATYSDLQSAMAAHAGEPVRSPMATQPAALSTPQPYVRVEGPRGQMGFKFNGRHVAGPIAAGVPAEIVVTPSQAWGRFEFDGITYDGAPFAYVDLFDSRGAPVGGGQAIVIEGRNGAVNLVWVNDDDEAPTGGRTRGTGRVYDGARWRDREGGEIIVKGVAAKANRAPTGAAPGQTYADRRADDLRGLRVSGDDYSGQVRERAVGCDGKTPSHVVGGHVLPRSRIAAAVKREALRAAVPVPPPPVTMPSKALAPVRAMAPQRDRAGHAPNTVYYFLRDLNGAPVTVLQAPHRGTVESIHQAAQGLQEKAAQYEHSHAGSQMLATNATGGAGWAVSPNLAYISPVGTDEAAYTLGDLSRAAVPSSVRSSAELDADMAADAAALRADKRAWAKRMWQNKNDSDFARSTQPERDARFAAAVRDLDAQQYVAFLKGVHRSQHASIAAIRSPAPPPPPSRFGAGVAESARGPAAERSRAVSSVRAAEAGRIHHMLARSQDKFSAAELDARLVRRATKALQEMRDPRLVMDDATAYRIARDLSQRLDQDYNVATARRAATHGPGTPEPLRPRPPRPAPAPAAPVGLSDAELAAEFERLLTGKANGRRRYR